MARLAHASDRAVAPKSAQEITQVPGLGLRGVVEGSLVLLGSVRFLAESEIDTEELEIALRSDERSGASHVAIAIDGRPVALFLLTDTIRPHAREALAELAALGLRSVMITGDSRRAGAAVATRLGIDEVIAEVRPEGKVEAVESLISRHGRTAMVGDGINDAPAMARADLAVAMGEGGTDVALETADVALMGEDLRRIPWLIRHSRRALGIIRANIALALGIKLVVLVGTFFGLASLWGAIIADIGATLLVSANALRLLSRKKE